jgi:hypothetical protein
MSMQNVVSSEPPGKFHFMSADFRLGSAATRNLRQSEISKSEIENLKSRLET